MPTYLRWFNTIFVLAVLVGGPWGYYLYRDRMSRGLHVVEDGVLYRSGQLPTAGLARLVHDHGIRTIVSLRDSDSPEEQAEVKYCERWGLNYVRIPPRAWSSPQGRAPVTKGLEAFRNVMKNPANYPVLIHCFAGVHRTGAYCAVYRMDFQGWSNHRALAELRRLGYDNLDDDLDVAAFLHNYRPAANLPVRAVSRQR